MDSIRIDPGIKRVMVNDDPERVIEFNPADVAFAERFYSLIGEFEAKQIEYQERGKKVEANTKLDNQGLPTAIGPGLALLNEMCEFLRERIDYVFGPGTSQKAFGDARTLEMFEQFFHGIMPYFHMARAAKLQKYNGKNRRRVMK